MRLVVCGLGGEVDRRQLPASVSTDRPWIHGGERSLYELAAAAASLGHDVELRGEVRAAEMDAVCRAAGARPRSGLGPRLPTADDLVVVPEGYRTPRPYARVAMSPARGILYVLAPPGLFGWPFVDGWRPPDPLLLPLDAIARPEHFRAMADAGFELWSNSAGTTDAALSAGVTCTYLGVGVPGGFPDPPDKRVDVVVVEDNRWSGLAGAVEERLPASVRWIPRLPRPEFLRALGEGRLLIWPSRIEGSSRIQIEARAMGTVPVALSTNRFAEGLDEDHGAVLVDDVQAMPAAAARLLADPERLADLSDRARTTAREQVDWGAFVSRVDRALSRSMTEGSGSATRSARGREPTSTVSGPQGSGGPNPGRGDEGRPAIGLWGKFDLENFGDVLLGRIAREELLRRMPDADIRVFGPLGYPGLNRFDSGDPVESLGRWSSARVRDLAAELDCVVIGGGDIIHARDELLAPHYGMTEAEMFQRQPSRFFIEGLGPETEAIRPVVWNAVGIPFEPTADEAERLRRAVAARRLVAVRDEGSLQRLRTAGVEHPVEVVPDPAFLLPRHVPEAVIEKRLGFLRRLGWFPDAPGTAIVVQGNRGLIPFAGEVAGQLEGLLGSRPNLRVVLVETGPCHGDGEFADALAELIPDARRLGSVAGIEDVAAVIAGSAAFVGSSLHGNIAAVAFRRPHVVLDLTRESKLRGFAGMIGDPECRIESASELALALDRSLREGTRVDPEPMWKRVDEHFDAVATIASEGTASRPRGRTAPAQRTSGPPEGWGGDLTQMASTAREHRLLAQRWEFADRLATVELEADGHRREAERLLFELQRAAEHVRVLEARIAEIEAYSLEREDVIDRLDGEVRELKADVEWARGLVADRERTLSELTSSRSVRYTAPLRSVFARVRRRRGGA